MKSHRRSLRRRPNPFVFLGPLVLVLILVFAVQMEENNPPEDAGEVLINTESQSNTKSPSKSGSIIPASIMEVHFLDVGQGDSVLVTMPNGISTYTMLIDSGEARYGETVAEYLRDLEIDRIDVLINTHPHADHMGSMAKVIDEFEIGEFYMPQVPEDDIPITRAYERLLDAVIDTNMRANPLYKGAYIDFPAEGQIEVLWPERDTDPKGELNNISGVIRLSYGDTIFLFMGDAEAEVEDELLESDRSLLQATVLKCGHHGSDTATTEEFAEAVNPQIAVISCGEDNSYGHPHPRVMQTLGSLDCELWRTDMQGTMVIRSDGERVSIEKRTNKPEAP